MRKEIMKLGKITKVEVLNKDDDGKKYPNKKDWGYCIEATVNGYHICCPDRSWYEAWKAMLDCARWSMTEPTFIRKDELNENLEAWKEIQN